MSDNLQNVLEGLLNELRPLLKPIAQSMGLKWVREANQFKGVEVDTSETHRVACVIHALWTAKNEDWPVYTKLVDAIAADSVFRSAEKRHPYYGTPQMLIETAVINGVANPNNPVLAFERAWAELMRAREVFGAKSLTWQVRARIIGLELGCSRLTVSENVEIVRLTPQEILDKLPIVEAFEGVDFRDEFRFCDHTTELQISITLPIDDTKEYAFITTGTEAQKLGHDLAEDLLLALRFSWPGHVSYRDFEFSGNYSGRSKSNFLSGPYSIVGSMQLPADAESQVHKAMASLREARKDSVLRTSLQRYFIGRAPRAPHDQIVDYVIAWESILLTVGGNAIMQESAFRFSVNGALLLASCGAQLNRHYGAEFMKGIYHVRSKIVHGGSDKEISKAIKTTGIEDLPRLVEILETYYRMAVAWLVQLHVDRRPYRGSGWDDLLWEPKAQSNAALHALTGSG